MEPLGAVIATRYHNLIAALKLSKPTIAIGYSPKHEALMSDMGLSEYYHSVKTLDIARPGPPVPRDGSPGRPVAGRAVARNAAKTEQLENMFELLDEVLFDRPVQPSDSQTDANMPLPSTV